ncbi:hypothetical protein RHMOL_Rhmol04G0139400 [Rhododendron molle]|uniref:Uncharacterized protein n=1 Tax=Rhododendron molle TaxID=49168 RepID=A0ACC0P203_RHOML|nr:hypothetical protein RHMOL_Rhmol04G0139400 [Rhododendron molle]
MNAVSEFFEKSIKALDICNATRDGIQKIRLWQKHLEFVLCALNSRQRTVGKGQSCQAREDLTDLAFVMLDEKETDNGCHDPDKGSRTPNALTILWQYSRGSPLLLIHDRFMDKSKKHERRNSNGLLKEILSDGDMHSSDDRLGALRDGVHAI